MDEAYGRFLQESCRLGIVPELPVKPQKKKEVLVPKHHPFPTPSRTLHQPHYG